MAQIKGTTGGFSVTLNYTLTSSDAYYTFTPSTIATVYNSSSFMCYGMALCTNKTNWDNARDSFVEDGDGNIFYDAHEIWETRTEDVSYYGSVKIPRQTSASTVYLAIYMGYQNNWGITSVPGSTTPCATVTINVPALASYTVSYDANGGTGSVASQTKYYGKSLTLQDNSFSKTDGMYTINGSQVSKFYNFTKWNTKADGTGTDYAAKASYTANSAATMYAQWKRNPFISAFSLTRADSSGNPDDMGGRIRCVATWDTDPTLTGSTMVFSCGSASTTVSVSGSSGEATGIIDMSADPSQQYTVTATLTDSAGYTRAITATSTTEYTAPAITSASVERVDDQGDLSDDGEYMSYEVSWRVANIGSQTGPASLLVQVYSDSAMTTLVHSETVTSFTPTASGVVATGTSSNPLISITGGFSTEDLYYARFTLMDNAGKTAAVNSTLPIAYFPFDILRGGHGAAFGKPSKTAELLDVGYGINSDVGYLVGGEQAYPTFIRAGWSESSDESTLPVTPCFVLNPTNSAYYYCDGQ